MSFQALEISRGLRADLTFPCAIFICGDFLKSRVYVGKPRTLGELKTAIGENIREIGEETLVKVEANFRKQLQICARENGHHLSDIIFHSKILHNGIV